MSEPQPLTFDEVRNLLIQMRQYAIYHGILIGECVAWNKLKAAFNVDAAFDEELNLKPENLRVPQTPETGIGAIIGKWPGNETDEEINEALERLS